MDAFALLYGGIVRMGGLLSNDTQRLLVVGAGAVKLFGMRLFERFDLGLVLRNGRLELLSKLSTRLGKLFRRLLERSVVLLRAKAGDNQQESILFAVVALLTSRSVVKLVACRSSAALRSAAAIAQSR